ncbi:hypothetical protein [Novosphingobium resinovorum]|uniref:hypothetical protein n=1 Tax=Novosphingobium resinovorum TaxID=158500 RepID=UPI0012EA0457|nr:hypothetical protein [Novosphingobium resinovorum]
MTIIPFPGHHRARCTRKECLGCHLCHGALFVCTRCGGAEGSLPTDCPGERMTEQQHDDVYAGHIDFVHRRGWVAEASFNSPARYK